jgi:hypothetical protein
MRVLSYETQPPVRLEVARDGADNFTVRALDPGVSGPHRLVFLVDAPATYFAPRIPREVTLPQVAAVRAPAPLPPRVRRAAQRVLDRLGVAPGDPAATALDKLVAYFRAFEAGAPPSPTGDVYLDLALSQRGVCRHRAYGFVVTAQALGIPARFVQNEAHSWVEVKLPGHGFMRIDLGGAAHGLNAHGSEQRPAHQPAEPDRLPRPPAFEESYSLAAANAAGRRPELEQLAGRWVEPGRAQVVPGASDDASYSAAPGEQVMAHEQGAMTERSPVRLTLDHRRASVLRGAKLAISGRAQDASGAGIAGLRVEVSLASPERRARMLLGVGVSDGQGYFRGSYGVPLDLDVGDYQLVVLTPGNEAHLPAIAQ